MTAEITPVRVLETGAYHASMRPRSNDRGNLVEVDMDCPKGLLQ